MSPRILRIDSSRIEAMVFRADSVRFEACASFRATTDPELCDCGWLEVDHGDPAVSRRRMPRRRPHRDPIVRAS
jgi:hypothetical protein